MADTWWRGIHGEIWVVSETRIHMEIEGIFHVDSLGISRRFPAEFIRIFGGFIGDKSVADFQGNPQRFSWEIMGNLQRSQGEI